MVSRDAAPLLSLRDVEVTFTTEAGRAVAARGVSFDVMPGETVAIEDSLAEFVDGDGGEPSGHGSCSGRSGVSESSNGDGGLWLLLWLWR